MATHPADPELVALGRAIRRRREALRAHRTTLAQHADVSVSQLGRIERGEADPQYSTVVKISEALGLDSAELERLIDQERGHSP